MNMKSLFSFCLLTFSSYVSALLDPEQIASMVIKADNPDLVMEHISEAKSLSTQSLYPELALSQRLPFDGQLNSRLELSGSEVIPELSSSLFKAEGLQGLSISDPAS